MGMGWGIAERNFGPTSNITSNMNQIHRTVWKIQGLKKL